MGTPRFSLPRFHYLALLTAILFASTAARAQDGALARCQEVKGALLTGGGQSWQAIKAGDNIPAGTTLVALFEADLTSANKAVAVKLLGDIGMFGPLPVFDTAVRVLDAGSADLTLGLDHGLIILTNAKESGA